VKLRLREHDIGGVLTLESKVFADDRGYFIEAWNKAELSGLGFEHAFIQDNLASSARHVLRGLHFQIREPQGKLVRAVAGTVFDVAVDLRRASPTFGQWTGEELSESNGFALWVPPGFAHGYLVLSETAVVHYKCTTPYAPSAERTLRWDDPTVGIRWPLPAGNAPRLSARDATAPLLEGIEVFE
jgi:dTDP-4-dehydrorhamnose 3,5-epimerase